MKDKKKRKKFKYDPNIIKIAHKTTPSQRLEWLEKAREFTLKTVSKSKLRLILHLREEKRN